MKRPSARVFVIAGLAVALALAFFVSPYASTQPDGLNKVAAQHGLDHAARSSAMSDGPTAGYEVEGIDDRHLSKGVAGLLGVTVTFLLAGGLVVLVRRRAEPAGTVT